MKPDLQKSTSDFLNKHKIKGKIAIACSGGIDSMALAYLLARGQKIIALIVDHGLRKESANEAKKTAKILDNLGIENVTLKKKNKIKSNLQEEARKLRYGLLLDYCQKHKIKYLATAHHAEDNAETFLLRLSRGSGLDGLSSIAEISEIDGITLIRPLLSQSKNDLKALLSKNRIKWVEDPTNKTDKYKRNQLRQVLSKLEDSELITSRINDAAGNLARVRDFMEGETKKAFSDCCHCGPDPQSHLKRRSKIAGQVRNDESVNLDMQKFTKLHDEIAYRVLVKLIMQLSKAEKKPRFDKLKRLKTDLINGQTRTLNGLIFRSKGNKIIIAIEKP